MQVKVTGGFCFLTKGRQWYHVDGNFPFPFNFFLFSFFFLLIHHPKSTAKSRREPPIGSSLPPANKRASNAAQDV